MNVLLRVGRALRLTARRPAPARLIREVQSLPGVQSGTSVTISRDAAWVHLPRGVDLRYEHAFNSVTDILLRAGTFEEFEVDLMARSLSDGAVVVDVGANVGLFSIAAARAARGITVHAFEPVPATCDSLRVNVARNGVDAQVSITQAALSDHDGEAFVTTEYHGSNYLTGATSVERKVAVPALRLDSYVRDRCLPRVDFLKIDVEGHELSVLKGAIDAIRRFTPVVLVEIIERDSKFHDRVVEARDEVVALMATNGYSFEVIGDRGELLEPSGYTCGSSAQSYHNYVFTPCRTG